MSNEEPKNETAPIGHRQKPPPLPRVKGAGAVRDGKFWSRVAFVGVLPIYLGLGVYLLNWYLVEQRVEELRLGYYGVNLNDDADCERAIAAFDELLALRPADLEALSQRARCQLSLQRYEAAAADYERVLALEPVASYALFASSALGNIYRKLGDHVRALENYEGALTYSIQAEANWNLARCHGDLGLLLLEQGDEHGARVQFEMALEAEPNIDSDPGLTDFCRRLFNLYPRQEDPEALAGKMLSVASTLALPARVAHAHAFMGSACRQSGELARAEIYLSKSLHIREEIGDRDEIIRAIGELASVLGMLGQRAELRACYAVALAAGNEEEVELARAETLMHLGDIGEMAGDDLQAELYYQRALALHQSENNVYGAALIAESLGMLKGRNGDLAEAEFYFMSARDSYGALGDMDGVAALDVQLAAIYYDMGDLTLAASRLHGALRQPESAETSRPFGIAGVAGDPRIPAVLERIHRQLGNIALSRGEYDEAACHYQERLLIATEAKLPFADVSATTRMGMLHLLLGEFAHAEQYYETALAKSEHEESPIFKGVVLDLKISLAIAARDFEIAEESCLANLAICGELGLESAMSGGYSDLSEIRKEQGDWEEAERWLRESLSIARQRGAVESIAWRELALADLLRLQGDYAGAESILKDVMDSAEERGYRPLGAEASAYLAQVYADLELTGRAAAQWQHALGEFEAMGLAIAATEIRYSLEDLGVPQPAPQKPAT